MNDSVVQSVHLALCFLKQHSMSTYVLRYSCTLHKRPRTYWLVGCFGSVQNVTGCIYRSIDVQHVSADTDRVVQQVVLTWPS
jgi:hypothetical protein